MNAHPWVAPTLTVLMVLATLFALLSVFTTWATDGDPDLLATAFSFGGVSSVTDGDEVTVSLGSEVLDDHDGIGLARAGAVLGFIAVLLFVAGTIAFENQWLTGNVWIGLAGTVVSAVGAVLWLLALILFPIGVTGLADAVNGGFGSPDLAWGAGLAFGIVAAVLGLAAAGIAVVHRIASTGFRLELADDAGYANFD